MFHRLLMLIALGFSAQVAAEPVATVASPSGVLAVVIDLDGEGRIRWQVDRLGQPVIAPSTLGFLIRDAGRMERGFELAGTPAASSVDSRWEQPWGESRFVTDRHNELRVPLREREGSQRHLTVVVRAFDDGVGLRYEFPDQATRTFRIEDELTEFRIAPRATAWWIPAGENNRYEYLYRRTPLGEVGTAHTPITMRTDDGLHLSIHEAALVDYSGMWLRRVDGQTLVAQLAPGEDGAKVVRDAPFATPWRTVTIADTAGGLVEANLILNLNEPNKLGDMSWFTPHKYVGVWWAMHLDEKTWASGPKHGATTAEVSRVIDFASANKFRGVLVEGWNVGWDGQWFGNGRDFDFTKPYPDFDMAELSAYAKAKNVRLIGHHETGGNICNYERQLDAAMDYYQANGVDAVKTGYVADAGGVIDCDADGREITRWHDGQRMSRHHLKVVEAAAARHIAVNAHEPIKDTGLRRTYPNWISREGARGMEYNAWANPTNPPEHEVNLVFTRMLAGPMDFTPGVLSLTGRGGQRIESTIAKQLALYVVLYSPIQMAADLPENYARFPAAFQFIKDVPTDWSETRVLNGEVGDFVTIARKDRAGEDWYLGAVTDENGRLFDVPLSFLTPGKRYTAQIYRDGPAAGVNADRFDIAIEERAVTAADRLPVRLSPGGGLAVRFKAR